MKEADIYGKHFHINNEWQAEPKSFGDINLIQIGEMSCEMSYEAPEHTQWCFEISCVVQGTGSFYVNDERHVVSEGEIFFNRPDEVHSIKANLNSKLRFLFLAFDFPEEVSEDFEPIANFFRNNVQLRKVTDKYYMRDTIESLLREFYIEQAFSNVIMKSYLYEILVKVYRLFNLQTSKKSFVRLNKENDLGSTLYSVVKYIEDNIFSLNNVSIISDDLSYSQSYISHLFRQKMGITLQAYVNYKRLEKSAELLEDEGLTITQIANKLSYESIYAYSKAFKNHFGISPSKFRRHKSE